MKNTETKAAKFEAGKTYYTTWRKSDGCEQIITCTIEKRTAHSVTINGKRHMIPRIDGTLAYPDIEYILVTADDGWKMHVDARNIYAAEAENNTEETVEISGKIAEINERRFFVSVHYDNNGANGMEGKHFATADAAANYIIAFAKENPEYVINTDTNIRDFAAHKKYTLTDTDIAALYNNEISEEIADAAKPMSDDISDICKYKPDIEDDNNRLDWDDSAIGNTEDESEKIFTAHAAYNAAVEATFKEQHPSGWATLESVVYVNGIAYPESDFRKKVATDPIVHFGGKVYFESDLRKQQAKVATANQPVEVNDPLNDIELDELDGSENEPDEDCFALLPDIDELVDVDWIDDNETVNPDNPPTPELSITQKWAKEILDGLGSLIVKFGGAGKTKDGGLALHYNTFRNEHDEFGAPIFIVECFKPKDIFCNNPYRLDHVNVIKGYGDDKVVTTYYMPTDKGNRRIEININGESITFVDGKPNYIWSEKYHAGFSYYSSKFVANIYRDGKLFAHKLIHEDEEFFALMIERGACTIDTPPVNPPEPQDTLAAVAGTCAALNAAAPEGWEIFYDAEDKSFPIEFKGRQVTKLDSLATQKFLTPEKFFGQFKSLVDEDYSPYQEFVDSLYKERNALEEMREELVSDKDRFKTLTAMIAQIDRDIAAAELPF